MNSNLNSNPSASNHQSGSKIKNSLPLFCSNESRDDPNNYPTHLSPGGLMLDDIKNKKNVSAPFNREAIFKCLALQLSTQGDPSDSQSLKKINSPSIGPGSSSSMSIQSPKNSSPTTECNCSDPATEKAMHDYIYEFLCKRNYFQTAEKFVEESMHSPGPVPPELSSNHFPICEWWNQRTEKFPTSSALNFASNKNLKLKGANLDVNQMNSPPPTTKLKNPRRSFMITDESSPIFSNISTHSEPSRVNDNRFKNQNQGPSSKIEMPKQENKNTSTPSQSANASISPQNNPCPYVHPIIQLAMESVFLGGKDIFNLSGEERTRLFIKVQELQKDFYNQSGTNPTEVLSLAQNNSDASTSLIPTTRSGTSPCGSDSSLIQLDTFISDQFKDMPDFRSERALRGEEAYVRNDMNFDEVDNYINSYVSESSYSNPNILTSLRDELLPEVHKGKVLSCSLSPDTKYLATAGQDMKICIWSVKDKKLIETLEAHTGQITQVKFAGHVVDKDESTSSYTLASGSYDKNVKIWNIFRDTGNKSLLSWSLAGHSAPICSLDFNPNKKSPGILCSGDSEGNIFFWLYKMGRCVNRMMIGGVVRYLLFHPLGECLAIANDAKVILMDMSEPPIRAGNSNLGQMAQCLTQKRNVFYLDWMIDKQEKETPGTESSSPCYLASITDQSVCIFEYSTTNNNDAKVGGNFSRLIDLHGITIDLIPGEKVNCCSLFKDGNILLGGYQKLSLWKFKERGNSRKRKIRNCDYESEQQGMDPTNESMLYYEIIDSNEPKTPYLVSNIEFAHGSVISSLSSAYITNPMTESTSIIIASTGHDSLVKIWSN